MTKLSLSSLLFVIYFSLFSCSKPAEEDPLKPVVDERVELMSILARLADFEEYNVDAFGLYAGEIGTHFSPYREDRAVTLMRELRDDTGLAYDAVMAMAVNLEYKNGKWHPISNITEIDDRWPSEYTVEFYAALNEFYINTGFEQWFQNQLPIFDSLVSRANHLSEINQDWFQQFFGTRNRSTFRLVLAPGNGYGNYGPKSKDENGVALYAIIGCGDMDEAGFPVFEDEELVSTVIHEFCHSYVNPLVDEAYPLLSGAAVDLYAAVTEEMDGLKYSEPRTVMYESLVRASVVQYMMDHDFDEDRIAFQRVINKQIGFYWLPDLVDELLVYQDRRVEYPTMQSYMQELGEFFKSSAASIEEDKHDFLVNRARVVKTSPENGAIVDANLDQISFTFDGELIPGSLGFGRDIGQEEALPKYPNEDDTFTYSKDRRTIIIQHVKLEPNTSYKIRAHGRFFRTYDERLGENYVLNFQTK